MKKGAIIFLFFFGLAIFISSCSKNNFDQPGFPGLRCNPGNTEYVADTAYYVRNGGTTIFAQTGANTRIKISMIRQDTTGTIALDAANNVAYYLDGVNTYRSTSGSVVITQYYNDSLKMMSGTFGFNAISTTDSSNTINVSYGYFNNIPRH